MKAVFLLLALVGGVAAQAPQSPCAEADLRRSMAESRAEAAEAKLEAKALRQENLERDNARQKQLLDSSGQHLATEQKHSAMLAASYAGAQTRARDLQAEKETLAATVAALTTEREKLELKIERANKRFMCRVFHLGCIGDR